jgi:hypothetical protein
MDKPNACCRKMDLQIPKKCFTFAHMFLMIDFIYVNCLRVCYGVRVSRYLHAPLSQPETDLRATGGAFSPAFTRIFVRSACYHAAQSKINQAISRVGEGIRNAKYNTLKTLFNIINIIGKRNAFKRCHVPFLRSLFFRSGSPRKFNLV